VLKNVFSSRLVKVITDFQLHINIQHNLIVMFLYFITQFKGGYFSATNIYCSLLKIHELMWLLKEGGGRIFKNPLNRPTPFESTFTQVLKNPDIIDL